MANHHRGAKVTVSGYPDGYDQRIPNKTHADDDAELSQLLDEKIGISNGKATRQLKKLKPVGHKSKKSGAYHPAGTAPGGRPWGPMESDVPTSHLWFGNLDAETDAARLRDFVQSCCPYEGEAKLPIGDCTVKGFGGGRYGIVSFLSKGDAERVYELLGSQFAIRRRQCVGDKAPCAGCQKPYRVKPDPILDSMPISSPAPAEPVSSSSSSSSFSSVPSSSSSIPSSSSSAPAAAPAMSSSVPSSALAASMSAAQQLWRPAEARAPMLQPKEAPPSDADSWPQLGAAPAARPPELFPLDVRFATLRKEHDAALLREKQLLNQIETIYRPALDNSASLRAFLQSTSDALGAAEVEVTKLKQQLEDTEADRIADSQRLSNAVSNAVAELKRAEQKLDVSQRSEAQLRALLSAKEKGSESAAVNGGDAVALFVKIDPKTYDGLALAKNEELEDLSERLKTFSRRVKEEMKLRRSSDSSCIVCMEPGRVASVAIVPCGHLVVCGVCSKRITSQCPACRGPVASLLNIFKLA
eukprot:TRINITY_DN27448_c0_g1_i1.p1 TRINITY_DN27448_c0_g1~~TRINITY_DN27448_c0_g1_i1.p1  ORF type:complete len:527 (+),score=84.53 TRINITY_DN27448_c0_g1_i1:84-1664(+)